VTAAWQTGSATAPPTFSTTTATKSLAYATNSNLYVGTTQGSTRLRSVVNDAAGNMLTDSTHPSSAAEFLVASIGSD
jgi:hypothetical protein